MCLLVCVGTKEKIFTNCLFHMLNVFSIIGGINLNFVSYESSLYFYLGNAIGCPGHWLSILKRKLYSQKQFPFMVIISFFGMLNQCPRAPVSITLFIPIYCASSKIYDINIGLDFFFMLQKAL